jgi:hypothetical protein
VIPAIDEPEEENSPLPDTLEQNASGLNIHVRSVEEHDDAMLKRIAPTFVVSLLLCDLIDILLHIND